MTIALPADATDDERAGAAAFEALVEGLSGGALAVDVAPPESSCGAPRQCLDALQEGSISVTRAAVEDVAAFFPAIRILDVPYLFEDQDVVDRVLDGPFAARLRDALVAGTGLRPLAIGTRDGWRTLATTRRAVRTPADVRGLALATGGSPIEADLVRALDGAPAGTERRELAAALDDGRLDGVTLPLAELVALGLHEHVRHVTLDRHAWAGVLWLTGDAFHEALPAPLRQVVEAGFEELARLTLANPAGREADAIRAVEAAGGVVQRLTEDERKAFLMAAGGVATGYVDAYGSDWLVWIEGAIAEAEREIAIVRARVAAGGR